MKSTWTKWTLIAAGIAVLVMSQRLDLVLLVAPLSILVSYFAAHVRTPGQRRM